MPPFRWTERRAVAALSLLVTWLFFGEYLPPLNRAHLVCDIGGFHYPLINYAFKILRAGGFPEWDPGIYCGISFAGNIQAALFYPPLWLMFAANWGKAGLPFGSIQIYVVLHFWIGFMLTFVWLRERGLLRVASLCGAASFAYSGFLMNEIQHL